MDEPNISQRSRQQQFVSNFLFCWPDFVRLSETFLGMRDGSPACCVAGQWCAAVDYQTRVGDRMGSMDLARAWQKHAYENGLLDWKCLQRKGTSCRSRQQKFQLLFPQCVEVPQTTSRTQQQLNFRLRLKLSHGNTLVKIATRRLLRRRIKAFYSATKLFLNSIVSKGIVNDIGCRCVYTDENRTSCLHCRSETYQSSSINVWWRNNSHHLQIRPAKRCVGV